MSYDEGGRGKKAPVGTQRKWDSSDQVMIKTHDNGPFDDFISPWMPMPSIAETFRVKFSSMDEIGRKIIKYKEPIDGDLWLEKEFTKFTTTSGKEFTAAQFKRYSAYSSSKDNYSFTQELTKRLEGEKIALNAEIAAKLEEANETKKSYLIKQGERVDFSKKILLDDDEIKSIRVNTRNDFKYDQSQRLTMRDTEEIEAVLRNVLDKLEAGEDFTGEQAEVYQKAKLLLESLKSGPYRNVSLVQAEMKDMLVLMDNTFQDNWGIRESYKKKLSEQFTKYIKKYISEIEQEQVEEFTKMVGCSLYDPHEIFYKKLKESPLFSQINIQDYIGKIIAKPEGYDSTSKYEDVTLISYDPLEESMEVRDILGKQTTHYIKPKKLEDLIRRRQLNISTLEIPLRIRFQKLYDKGLEGGFTERELTLLETCEKLTDVLPHGHFITNSQLKQLRKPTSWSGDNTYAHYSPREREIYLSDDVTGESDRAVIDIHNGKEYASTLIHEIGHAVSMKLGRRSAKLYRVFVRNCGWSWDQFNYGDKNNNYVATGEMTDIKRFGSRSAVPLITTYAHKSPEEAFAENYSFYTQYKKEIDHFLATEDSSLLERHDTIKISTKSKDKFGEHIKIDSVNYKENLKPKFSEIQQILDENKRSQTEHITTGVIDPYYDNLENIKEKDINPSLIVYHKRERGSSNKFDPLPVFTVVNPDGRHDIIKTDEGEDAQIHYANKYLRRLSPTYSISRECYRLLESKGYSYSEIKAFTLEQVKDTHIPQIITNTGQDQFEAIQRIKGLRYCSEFVPVDVIKKNKEVFGSMKAIWESEELKKAIEELFSFEVDSLQKSQDYKYEYITVHPKEGNPFQRLQRKRGEVHSEGKQKSLVTEEQKSYLFDQLVHNGVKYEGQWYNKINGDRIPIPQDLKNEFESVDAKSLSQLPGSKNWTKENGEQVTEGDIKKYQRKQLGEVVDTIKKKRELYSQVEQTMKDEFYNKQVSTIKRSINTSLSLIKKTSPTEKVVRELNSVRENISDSINPTIEFNFKGAPYERPLNELISSLGTKGRDIGTIYGAHFSDFKIKDFDNYQDEDFNNIEFDENSPKTIMEINKEVNRILDKDKNLLKSYFDKTLAILGNLYPEQQELLLDVVRLKNKTVKKEYSDVVVRNLNGEVLLLQRPWEDDTFPGKWCLPGGHVEDGEDYMEAGERELLEETGLNMLGILQHVLDLEKDECVIHYYTGVFIDVPVVYLDNSEHYRCMWVKPEDLQNYDMIFDLKETLLEIVDDLPPIGPQGPKKVDQDYFNDLLREQNELNILFDKGEVEEDEYIKKSCELKDLIKGGPGSGRHPLAEGFSQKYHDFLNSKDGQKWLTHYDNTMKTYERLGDTSLSKQDFEKLHKEHNNSSDNEIKYRKKLYEATGNDLESQKFQSKIREHINKKYKSPDLEGWVKNIEDKSVQKSEAEQAFEIIQKAFDQNLITVEQYQLAHKSYLEKGGKRAQLGETRTWSDGTYTKTKDGWVNLESKKEKFENQGYTVDTKRIQNRLGDEVNLAPHVRKPTEQMIERVKGFKLEAQNLPFQDLEDTVKEMRKNERKGIIPKLSDYKQKKEAYEEVYSQRYSEKPKVENVEPKKFERLD